MIARRAFFLALIATALLAGRTYAAEWRIAFQVVSEQSGAIYNKEVARTTAIISELGPPILGAIGLDPNSFDAEVVAGGYEGRMSPSVVMDIDGDAATADRLASACGLVFEQQSVLDWREADTAPDFAVDVAFQSLTPTLAEFFYRTAIGVNRGLAGGFTARDNRLLFINLRGADNKPLSGLADDQFAAALTTAAKAFGSLVTVRTLHVEAHLVAAEGGHYATAVGAAALPELDRLHARRTALVGAPQ